jgi:CII-binding regulator of phage lambda lysogenization HflD
VPGLRQYTRLQRFGGTMSRGQLLAKLRGQIMQLRLDLSKLERDRKPLQKRIDSIDRQVDALTLERRDKLAMVARLENSDGE